MAVAPVRQAVRRWWRVRQAPPAIYGTIISASVMAAVDDGTPVGEVGTTVVVTLIIYWLAERWSVVLGGYLQGGPTTLRRAVEVFVEGWPLVQAAYPPLLVMLAAYLSGAGNDASVGFAFAASVVELFVLGATVGRRAGLRAWGAVGSSVFTGTLGIVLAIMKATLH